MIQSAISITALLLVAACSVFSLWKSERRLPVYVLLFALIATSVLELFDLLATSFPGTVMFWKRYALMAEALLPCAWLLFSLTHARQLEIKLVPRLQRFLVVFSLAFPITVLTLPVDTFFYSPDFATERILFLNNTGFVFYVGLLVYMIVSLINLEATFSNASLISRWKIKFEVIGAGFFLAVLIFYYSQGLLYRTINMQFLPIRSLALVVALLMVSYSRLMRGNGVRIAVSRNMAYKSVVLFVVGSYLVALGMLGEGLKYFGEPFQRTMAVAFAFFAGLFLLFILLSETVKRKIRVFLHKNFYQSKYDYRTQWLQFTDRLSSSKSGDELLTSILAGYCETFGMGCGALFTYDAELGGYRVAARIEVSRQDIVFNRADPLISQMAGQAWVINANEDSVTLSADHEGFFKVNEITFLVPLLSREGMDAFVAVGKPLNRDESYNYEDYDLMKTFGRQASSAIMNLRLSEQLARSREMEAIGRVSTFVLHDLKNLVYTLSLITDNARDYMDDPEFQHDMLDSLTNTVSRMKVMISRLNNLPEKNVLNRESVDLLALTHETAKVISNGDVIITGAPTTAECDRDELQKVVLNLLVNALEATDGRGPVTVEVGDTNDPFIRVKDEGCGIPEDFLRSRIFSPFSSTKKKGLGIGLFQCKQIVEAHGGRIEVNSREGAGSVFTVWLPR